MRLTNLNEWLSLAANLGVLAGILFLVVEVSQNTRAINNESSWARVSVANDTYTMLVENEEIAELMIKYRSNPNVMDLPATPEVLRYRYLIEMLSRQNEARFLTRSDDLANIKSSTLRYLQYPGSREVYKSQLDLLTSEYRDFVISLIEEVEGKL